jgi:hypothetical protein
VRERDEVRVQHALLHLPVLAPVLRALQRAPTREVSGVRHGIAAFQVLINVSFSTGLLFTGSFDPSKKKLTIECHLIPIYFNKNVVQV